MGNKSCKNIVYTALLAVSIVLLAFHLFTYGNGIDVEKFNSIKKDFLSISSKLRLDIFHHTAVDKWTLHSSSDSKFLQKNDNVSITDKILRPSSNISTGVERGKVHAFHTVMSKGDTLYKILLRANVQDVTSFNITKIINKLYNLSKLKASDKVYIALIEDKSAKDVDGRNALSNTRIHSMNILLNEKILFKLRWNPVKKSYNMVSTIGSIEQIYDFDNSNDHINNRSSSVIDTTLAKEGINTYGKKRTAELSLSRVKLQNIIANHTTHSNNQLIYGKLSSHNLVTALNKANVNSTLIAKASALLSKELDIKNDLKKDSTFYIVYDRYSKKLLYISVETNKKSKPLELYRIESNGSVKFYHKNGESLKQELLTSPVHSAKISSNFGSRVHPILRYVRMHKGIDYRAPHGTPIVATGSGIIEKASINQHYGRYLKIKHCSQYSTLYAHMSRFAKGAKEGNFIKKGQIIGFVGSTGLANGNHVHYELIKNGIQINPTKNFPKIPSGVIIAKKVQDLRRQIINMDKMIGRVRVNENNIFFARNNSNYVNSIGR